MLFSIAATLFYVPLAVSQGSSLFISSLTLVLCLFLLLAILVGRKWNLIDAFDSHFPVGVHTTLNTLPHLSSSDLHFLVINDASFHVLTGASSLENCLFECFVDF
jgi:hypothetical protein